MIFQATTLEEIARGKFSDGISSSKFLENGEICVLTAHSVLLRISQVEASFSILDKLSSVDKSTLYCSHLVGSTWEDLIVFGGNAFGEVLIWKTSTILKKVPLLHRITAHQGVLFSINVSLAHGLMTTTSDDRSIKFWNLRRENSDVIVKAYRSAYAHTARVFQAKVVEEGEFISLMLCLLSVDNNRIFCTRLICVCLRRLYCRRLPRTHFGSPVDIVRKVLIPDSVELCITKTSLFLFLHR